jgi:hypothetical protein
MSKTTKFFLRLHPTDLEVTERKTDTKTVFEKRNVTALALRRFVFKCAYEGNIQARFWLRKHFHLVIMTPQEFKQRRTNENSR